MIKTNLPVILLKGLILLPNQEVRVELTNPITKKVINISKLYHDDEVLIVCPLNTLEEEPDINDLPNVGVTGKIKSYIELPNGGSRVVISGIERVKVYNYVNYSNEEDVLESIVTPIPRASYDEIEETAILRKLMGELENYINSSPNISNSIMSQIKGIIDLDKLTDIISNFIPLSFEKKLSLMLNISPIDRAKFLIREMSIEVAVGLLEEKLDRELKAELDEAQKEFILKEKIKVIRNELGEKDNKNSETEVFESKLKSLKCTTKVKNKIKDEIEKYKMIPETSPELSVTRNYIEYMLKVPWNKSTEDETDLRKIEISLNLRHHGMEEAKKRIVEYIATKNNLVDKKSPIICLSGPPGVGKTTFAESVATALNKKFVKVSLGGLNDTAEILGHRKTYIGASPGKIISGLVNAGVKNPVFLLDEIDKLTKDFRGDPASSLLEVLDQTYNNRFVDNYIDEEVDLSEVLFIVTANDVYNIPPALYDRLEIIDINGYTLDEKLLIAKDYLIKNILNNNNINKNDLLFDDEIIKKIINNYTKECGVRELDRLLNKVVRKVITEYKKDKKKLSKKSITDDDLVKYLGIPKYENNTGEINSSGEVKAIACSSVGGSIIVLESLIIPGKEEIKVTGSAGNILLESVDVALSYIKSNLDLFKIKEDSLNNKSIHINLREGAIPKDGPSAGSAITTTIISEITNKKVPSNISMTGEITLKGDILKVGGIKEKLIAAINDGIHKVYLPISNKTDVLEISNDITSKLKIIYVKNYIEIFEDIFS